MRCATPCEACVRLSCHLVVKQRGRAERSSGAQFFTKFPQRPQISENVFGTSAFQISQPGD